MATKPTPPPGPAPGRSKVSVAVSRAAAARAMAECSGAPYKVHPFQISRSACRQVRQVWRPRVVQTKPPSVLMCAAGMAAVYRPRPVRSWRGALRATSIRAAWRRPCSTLHWQTGWQAHALQSDKISTLPSENGTGRSVSHGLTIPDSRHNSQTRV